MHIKNIIVKKWKKHYQLYMHLHFTEMQYTHTHNYFIFYEKYTHIVQFFQTIKSTTINTEKREMNIYDIFNGLMSNKICKQ